MNDWPDVNVDQHGQVTCPIGECCEPLYLNSTYTESLYAEQDAETGMPRSAASSRWEVAYSGGHVLWTSADQARVSGNDPTDPDEDYDHMQLHKIVNALLGGQP